MTTASTLPEIIDLFAGLASHLKTLNQNQNKEEEEVTAALDLSISKLNQTLNLNDNSRGRVLDTALSLMCFKAPQVFDTVIEYSVKTIVSVLSASVGCKVWRFQNQEVLLIGSSITCGDCFELIQVCTEILGKLEGHGMLSNLLSRAVVRVAVSVPTYNSLLPLTPILDAKSIHGNNTVFLKLLTHLPKEFSLKNQEIPLRLLIWYLHPSTLKSDIVKILQVTMERPFLCLEKEFSERMEWQSVLICLVVSPTMFLETRALLHNWFLITGLASVLELLIELVSLILDVVSRPTYWGLPVELGSELPFSKAYFPYQCQLLPTLAGPLSTENFLNLIHGTSRPVYHASKKFDPAINSSEMKGATIDHKSICRALAIDFPDWFYFASSLMFAEESFQDIFQSKCTSGKSTIEQKHKMESPPYATAAAMYIAWILNPVSKSHQNFLVDCLTKLSESWTLKQLCSVSPDRDTAGYWKKLKKSKCHDKDCNLVKEHDCQTVRLWLRELQNLYKMYLNKTMNSSACFDGKASSGEIVYFRKIPLGILIGCSSQINEGGCELLLHYAATGKILQSRETRSARLKELKFCYDGQEVSAAMMDECNKEEAIAGACTVFRLTNIAESMATSMFEMEESELEFVLRMKVRACSYLTKCVKRLIQLNIEQNGVSMLMGLYSRLVQWRHKGREVLHFQNDLDDVISGLSHKISSLGQVL
ncbi:hypothetical protein CFOL_v3_21153 [Cephalotus follicularis]|uniref:Uncharacterized protein n=1 Tax=Cephalotus follicularis TaxID=3775 RepID=A0A1Q3CC46_CEPFO|nr:hypothetical protein CFOL_v3_21153 [Cephalotus follicularis]